MQDVHTTAARVRSAGQALARPFAPPTAWDGIGAVDSQSASGKSVLAAFRKQRADQWRSGVRTCGRCCLAGPATLSAAGSWRQVSSKAPRNCGTTYGRVGFRCFRGSRRADQVVVRHGPEGCAAVSVVVGPCDGDAWAEEAGVGKSLSAEYLLGKVF